MRKMTFKAKSMIAVGAVAALAATAAIADISGESHGGAEVSKAPQSMMMNTGARLGRLKMPSMDPGKGKEIFVNKGCVACHSINGVGGHDAPAMDAHEMEETMNPFDFAAKMWNHAAGMIAAQEDALGEQITFSGAELADIIAFVHNDERQHGFSENDLTEAARKMMDHEHGEMSAPESHADEVGHGHPEGEDDGHGDEKKQ